MAASNIVRILATLTAATALCGSVQSAPNPTRNPAISPFDEGGLSTSLMYQPFIGRWRVDIAELNRELANRQGSRSLNSYLAARLYLDIRSDFTLRWMGDGLSTPVAWRLEDDRASFNPWNEGEGVSLELGETPGTASLFFENGNEKWLPLKSEPIGPPIDAKQLVGTWIIDPDRSAEAWKADRTALLEALAPGQPWNEDAMFNELRAQLQKEAANPANVIKFVAGSCGGAETYVGLGADVGANQPQPCEIWEDGVILHRPSAKSRNLQGRYLVSRDGYLITDFGVGPRLFRKQP